MNEAVVHLKTHISAGLVIIQLELMIEVIWCSYSHRPECMNE